MGEQTKPEQNMRNRHIGCPNGVVLCIDRRHDGRMAGRLYHSYDTEPAVFYELDQAFRIMGELYDRLKFPMKGNKDRDFKENRQPQPTGGAGPGGRQPQGAQPYHHPPNRNTNMEGMIKVMNDEQLLKQQGDLGTFIIRVQHRQHNSWQGQITWVEKDDKQNFRSALELLRMIDHAVGTDED